VCVCVCVCMSDQVGVVGWQLSGVTPRRQQVLSVRVKTDVDQQATTSTMALVVIIVLMVML